MCPSQRTVGRYDGVIFRSPCAHFVLGDAVARDREAMTTAMAGASVTDNDLLHEFTALTGHSEQRRVSSDFCR